MMPNCDERLDDPVLATLTELARQSAPQATPAQLGVGWQAVKDRLAVRHTRRRRFARWSLVSAMACAVVLAVVGVSSWSPTRIDPTAPAALAYRVEGGSVLDGGYLRELSSDGMRLLFSEGTQFRLMPGARGRLRSVESTGARIAIEQGTASFQVTPRNNAKWLVDVGPFLVTVKGTVFTVLWDAASERLEIAMRHGQVGVTGPLAQGEIVLRAGQRLAVNLPKKELVITELEGNAWAEAALTPAGTETERPPAVVAPIAPTLAPSATATAKGSGRRTWAEALAAGDLDHILDQVDRMGVKQTLAKASSEELFMLADAARYRRRMGLARAALLAERKRFPGSARALDAAFLLGRMEESNERPTRKAIWWYEEYLSHAPTGTYASEALGRKMITTSKLAGQPTARPIAEEYLRRFPSGTYSGAARALLQAP
jgi:TolA-binding protein